MSGNSVTKACFAYKSGKKRTFSAVDYFGNVSPSWTVGSRFETYEHLWIKIDKETQALRSDVNSQLFDDIQTFVDTSHASFSPDEARDHRVASVELPTAVLLTGVNMPDHDLMFSNLAKFVRSESHHYLCSLKSKDCPNTKSTVSRILQQLLGHDHEADDLNESDLIDRTCKRSSYMSLGVIRAWYTDQRTSRKSRKRKDHPKVVIVIEDLEMFSASVVQDLITACSNYLHSVPIVFVLGVATSIVALHKLIPHSISSLLSIERFQATPSLQYLADILNKILLNPDQLFRVSLPVFNVLLDSFLYYDFSVVNFIKGLKCAMLDHFYTNPLSVLCCDMEETECRVGKMSSGMLEQMRHCASFRRYVDSKAPSLQKQLFKDTNIFKEHLLTLLRDIHKYHELFFPVLHCLYNTAKQLPGHPLGKQFRELYAECLDESIYEKASYKKCLHLVRTMAREGLSSVLQQTAEGLKRSNQGYEEDVRSVEDCLLRLASFDTEVAAEERPAAPAEALPKKTDMHTLQKVLLENKKKNMSSFDVLRTECVDSLDAIFRKYLVCPKSLPFHEVFYYDEASDLQQRLNASPRLALQTALSRPYRYLRNKELKINSEQISSTLPDICIAYRLHLECGRLINLYDWLQAFSAIVNEADDETDIDEMTQLRFSQAVSELQFLGFIKSTKRKTDHVARLTWGGC